MARKNTITQDDVMNGKSCDDQNVLENAADLAQKLTALFWDYPYGEIKVRSGYRDPMHNAKVGGARRSSHMRGRGVDISDNGHLVSLYCLNNIDKLKSIGLFMENPQCTGTWVHLDTVERKNTVFNP